MSLAERKDTIYGPDMIISRAYSQYLDQKSKNEAKIVEITRTQGQSAIDETNANTVSLMKRAQRIIRDALIKGGEQAVRAKFDAAALVELDEFLALDN